MVEKNKFDKTDSPQRYACVGINSTVTKHSDHFIWKDSSERMARRCDYTIDKKRVNCCVLKNHNYILRTIFSNRVLRSFNS